MEHKTHSSFFLSFLLSFFFLILPFLSNPICKHENLSVCTSTENPWILRVEANVVDTLCPCVAGEKKKKKMKK